MRIPKNDYTEWKETRDEVNSGFIFLAACYVAYQLVKYLFLNM